MEKEKKAKIIKITSYSALAIITFVTGMVFIPKLIREIKSSKDITKETNPDVDNPINPPVETANPIGTIDDVKRFQDWMDLKHANWLDNHTSLNKGFGYGNFGSQTLKAWTKYSTEYLDKTKNPNVKIHSDKKIYKAIAKETLTRVYKNVSDTIPIRWAGKFEYLGDLTGVVRYDYVGTKYLQLKLADGSFRYVYYNAVLIKKV